MIRSKLRHAEKPEPAAAEGKLTLGKEDIRGEADALVDAMEGCTDTQGDVEDLIEATIRSHLRSTRAVNTSRCGRMG